MSLICRFIVVFALTLGTAAMAQVIRYTSLCEEDMARLTPPKAIRVGTQSLTLKSGADLDIINSLRRELRASSHSNVVLYMFVEANQGIATLRFETRPNLSPLETIARQTGISPDRFKESLQAAVQPSSKAERARLRSQLLPEDMSKDQNKTVLFFDNDFYGAMPSSFELDNGFAFGSSTIRDAVAHATALTSARLAPSDITAFVGYPETDSELSAVFGDSKTAKLTVWQDRMKDMRQLAVTHQMKMFGLGEMRSLKSKGALLAEISASKGIVWIVAHSSGCSIRLSTGEEIQVTPSDIASLKLIHSPFVLIRVCDASDAGFAEAFLKAGARAVWVNKGVVTAPQVNQELDSFLENLQGASIADAIRQTGVASASYFRGATLYVENDHKSQEKDGVGNE